jgi:hypothetical protein
LQVEAASADFADYFILESARRGGALPLYTFDDVSAGRMALDWCDRLLAVVEERMEDAYLDRAGLGDAQLKSSIDGLFDG